MKRRSLRKVESKLNVPGRTKGRSRTEHLTGASSRIRNKLLSLSFPLWERLGVHITPVHFYQPIPDSRTLPPGLWTERSEMCGVDVSLSRQIRFLEALSAYREKYSEVATEAFSTETGFRIDNKSFGSVDAELLVAMIWHVRPKRVIEVGSGNSTRLLRYALGARQPGEEARPPRLVVIDPYPSSATRKLLEKDAVLIERPVEKVEFDLFLGLEPNDLLFIDSSHVLRIGGDVAYLYLEVLPRLSAGVYVHVHDIFLPAHYPKSWVTRKRYFWSEQYLLQAFLAYNSAFEVVAAAHFLHLEVPGMLCELFPTYDPLVTEPGSFWMRRAL